MTTPAQGKRQREAFEQRHLIAIAMREQGATLEQIGKHLGVSRERARQIWYRGMRDRYNASPEPRQHETVWDYIAAHKPKRQR
jgi:DNA-directed RNA polymerase sigma subunit (sigma70/sigma32)